MTTDAGDGIALHYVRQELAGLGTRWTEDVSRMREDVQSVRAAVDALAGEFRAVLAQQAPRIAVLERRADDLRDEIAELKAHGTRISDLERKGQGYERDLAALAEQVATAARNRSTLIITLAVGLIIAVVSAVLSWVNP